eukprot:COSAG01_NODE_29008_length_647_cov_2.129562_1_plen_34_part_10
MQVVGRRHAVRRRAVPYDHIRGAIISGSREHTAR